MATYAIVKTGGKQYKVAVGDLVKVEKIEGEPGTAVSLAPVLVVDGSDLTTDAAKLAKVAVTSEIVEHTKARRSASTSSRTRPVTTSVRATGSRSRCSRSRASSNQFFLANFTRGGQ